MTVVGPDGNLWSTGDPQVEGAVISVGVRPLGPAGTYTVNYRVTSADGHVVSGSWSFRLTVASTGTPGPSAPRDEPIDETASRCGRSSSRPALIVAGGACVGGATADVTRRRAVAGGAAGRRGRCQWRRGRWRTRRTRWPATLVRALADGAAVITLGLAAVPMLDIDRYRGELIRRATAPVDGRRRDLAGGRADSG